MEKGVSEVLGNLLILIIIAISISAILSYCYPLIMAGQENVKERNVISAMVFAKEKLDLVSSDTAPSTSLRFPPSGGSISITHDFSVQIYINNTPLTIPDSGEIVYMSGNRVIAIEMGGVWEKEGVREWMVYPPEVVKSGNSVSVDVTVISGEGSAGGYGITTVFMKYLYEKTYIYRNSNLKLVIKTEFPSAWKKYFESQGFSVSVNGNTVTAYAEGNVTISVHAVKVDIF